ncbi:MAG: tetratricopeptide repeat protein [Flavobacteriales bacterium]|nr:tetratricopeptide repeat protein [Flavobacteriales bacterium]
MGANAQDQRSIDSLNHTYINATDDTKRINTLLDLAEATYLSNPDTAIIICNTALEIAKNATLDSLTGECYGWLGYLVNNKGDIKGALVYFHNSLMIREKIGDKKGEANSLNNIAYLYDSQNEMDKALEYYNKSLIIYKDISRATDENIARIGFSGVASTMNNIGWIYDTQGDPDCTSSKEECGRMGRVKALEYYQKSLKIREDIGDMRGVAESLNNIGSINADQGDVEKGLQYLLKGLKIYEESGMKMGLANVMCNIGGLYFTIGNTAETKKYVHKGMELAKEVGNPSVIQSAAGTLKRLAKKEGNYKEALEMYELFVQMRDSLKNEETQKAMIRQQTKYEFEKAQLVREQEEKEAARLEAEATGRRDNLQYSVILIAILVLFGGVLALGFINVSERMAEGIIFFSFLILFEFLLVLADPYIEGWSGGAPGIKLLFNAGIAALIFPAHAFFESKLKGRLVKN